MVRGRTVGEGAFTKEAPPLIGVVALEGDELAKAQAWFEDKTVRAVRTAGYCVEALKILDKTFGAPLDKVGVYDVGGHYGSGEGSSYSGRLYPAYLDSEGRDCWNNVWRGEDKMDRNGLDVDGRDKDGYDKDGLDRSGFDRDGKDKNGVHRDDPARFAYDVLGYDREGYNREGYDKTGFNREGVTSRGVARGSDRFAFDANGYDKDGYNFNGYRLDGTHSDEVYSKYRQVRRNV